ncbi:MAG: LamG-like jellyroll fold domain-containing protein [bacterium]
MISHKTMSRIFLANIFALSIFLVPLFFAHADAFAGGTGAVENPYQISSCADILAVNNNLSASYVMTTDLDCSSDGNSRMIVNSFTPFSGTFDGAGHTITIAMNIGGNYVALFGQMDGATVKNLHLAGTSSGQGYVGSLAGFAANSKIYYVSSSVNITSVSNDIAGGLVGRMDGGFIKDSFVTGSVTGVNSVGGLVGLLQDGAVIQRSYADGAVTGDSFVGGFVGSIYSSTVTDSFSTGLVTGNTRGGFAGMMGGGVDLSSNYYDATTTGAGTDCAANGNGACHAVNSDGNDPDFFISNLASAPAPFDSWDFVNIWADDFSSLHSPLRNPITAPVGYWNFNENTGGIAADSTNGAHNATLENSPTWAKGNFGHAVSFNGSDTYASTTLPWTNSGSISTWVYPTSGAAGVSPAGWTLLESTNGYVAIDEGDGTHWRAIFTPDISGAQGTVVYSPSLIALNQWTHLVMTWSLDAGIYTVHLYVNGIDQGTDTWTGVPGAGGLGGFNIGRSGDAGSNYFAGKIDETKVYDYAIDQTAVSILSNETPDPVSALTTNSEAVDTITQTSARVFGNVTIMTPDDTYGEYGVVYELDGGDLNDTAPYASVAAPVFPVATGPFSVTITGLRCGTVYDYQMFLGTEGPRLYAVNTGTFTTLSCDNAAVSVSSGRLVSGAKPFGVTPKTPVLFTQNMKVGTVGGEVMMLQKFLNAKLYTVTMSGKETNTFGGKTKKAVQKFQKDHGLKPDGSFGPITRKVANDILIAEAK